MSKVDLDMQLEQFLSKYVEGYLYHDLMNMVSIWPKDGEDHGACGYPMVQSVIAGVELLGGLLHNDTYRDDAVSGKKYIDYYWDTYLAQVDTRYLGLKDKVRSLIRNGLAHTYLTKSGIGVTKGSPELHLSQNQEVLIVDCITFFSDFWKSYIDFVRPKIDRDPEVRELAARNVGEFYKASWEKASKFKSTDSSQPADSPPRHSAKPFEPSTGQL